MKIETTPHENHQVKIVAEFDADDFAGYKRRAARKIAKKTKIPGFRPGKAPYDIVERLVGAAAIQEEAIETLIDEQYANVLTRGRRQTLRTRIVGGSDFNGSSEICFFGTAPARSRFR